MSPEDARKQIGSEPRHFRMYRALGGRARADDYVAMAAMFIHLTFDSIVMGDGDPSKDWRRFSRWLAESHPGELPQRILESIDRVHAYT